MTSRSPQKPNRPEQGENTRKGMKQLIRGVLGAALLNAAACSPEAPSVQRKIDPQAELENLNAAIDEARKGQITPEEIQDEIEVQLNVGHVSEFMAKELGRIFQGEIEMSKELESEEAPSIWADINSESPQTTPGLKVLRYLEKNQNVLIELNRQLEKGMISEEEYKEILTHTLLAADESDLNVVRLYGTRDEARTVTGRLTNALFVLKMNNTRDRIAGRQLARGEIDEATADLLRSPERNSERKQAFLKAELREAEFWIRTGFADKEKSTLLKDKKDAGHDLRHKLLWIQEAMEDAADDEKKLVELEKSKQRLLNRARATKIFGFLRPQVPEGF